jgi:hypothetical protein
MKVSDSNKIHIICHRSILIVRVILNIYETKLNGIRFEVFTAVTMKNAVFWDVAPCRYFVNRRFGGTYRLNLVYSYLLTLVHRS